eukprot:CAMPEP_0194325192 /NCGR_PEP_ID=MMETSP0171-20130528/29096_1 /TAXON_ID=218684 /ORGANISM="Corethron pennatum, Strain L29A3" /LENGTH=465 /DNA_ID=CAMNT_0039084235 /DNA_START=110 /DNA_END=1507 /DNA_ORIENTATION=-
MDDCNFDIEGGCKKIDQTQQTPPRQAILPVAVDLNAAWDILSSNTSEAFNDIDDYNFDIERSSDRQQGDNFDIEGGCKKIDQIQQTPPRQTILPVNDPNAAWEILSSNNSQAFKDIPKKELPYQKQSEEEKFLRIACISDTHGRHDRLFIPPCDVLIHAGDLTMTGELGTLRKIVQFFGEQPAKKAVVYIAGNHDLTLQPDHYDRVWSQFHRSKIDTSKARNIVESSNGTNNRNIQYLEDSSYTVDGVRIYGSPWQPEFGGWAFNKERADLRDDIWSAIPSNIDVLITHGPPLGRGDLLYTKRSRVGCVDLTREIQNRILPRLHICGHIHEDYGLSFDGTTLYVNASSVNSCFSYQIRNNVIIIDLPLHDVKLSAQWVRPQTCTKSCDELIQWLGSHGKQYEPLIPYFRQIKKRKELEIAGPNLVGDQADSWGSLCQKLGLPWDEHEILHDMIMHLTAEAYGSTW